MNADGRLISFDLRTGISRDVVNGSYTAARPSPDGTYLALVRDSASEQPMLEIRSVNGTSVGDPIATAQVGTPSPGGPSFFWTRDSQRLIFASGTTGTQTTNFKSLALNGSVSTFYSLRNAGFTALVGLTPDGQHVVYVAAQGQIGGLPWAYLQVGINGGEPQELSAGGSPTTLTAYLVFREPIVLVASPNSDVMALTVQLPFSLPPSAQGGSSFLSNVVLAFDSNGQKVGVLLDQLSDLTVLGWLPEDALSMHASELVETSTGDFHETANSVQGMDEASQLTADSQVSPDGGSVLIYDSIYGFSMSAGLNDVTSGQPRRKPFLQTAGPPDRRQLDARRRWCYRRADHRRERQTDQSYQGV